MRFSAWLNPFASHVLSRLTSTLILTSVVPLSHAVNFKSAPATNLDLSDLGRVGLAGNFEGISLFHYEGQSENGLQSNGSQSVLAPYPDGGFATLQSADAGIQTMCTYIMNDGSMTGVVVGGNFTSLGGIESPGAALFNPDTSAVTPLAGLSGQVYALLCDQETGTVYVGGSFKGGNSTNAIAWSAGWVNLPFSGLNGPVTSIAKAANGKIIFGGSFTGLGNTSAPTQPDVQVINISGAKLSSGSSTLTAGYSDPSNIVCITSSADSSGNTWLLTDDSPGFWKADFGFGFEPTKLRLYNTRLDGRGTKTFRFTAEPLNGIMNFTYVEPSTGQNASCSSECPLSNNASLPFQEFHFVNQVGMNSFRIDISDWYGSGGGLDGIELFQDEIFAYAINAFNEPPCAGLSTASAATTTGPWAVEFSHDSSSQYLITSVTSGTEASVVFQPDLRQSGNYSVNIYTPGCRGDDTCSERGSVNITGTISGADPLQTTISQTNNFPKYDQIYFGYIEASTGPFRPSITLTPSSSQSGTPLTVVAQRVGFTLISSDGGLNGLFEYDPKQAVINPADFANSAFDQAGVSMRFGSGVNALLTVDDTTYVGGNFSTSNSSNILAVGGSSITVMEGAGLNGEVTSLFANESSLYVGGEFTDTKSGGRSGLNNIAVYDISKKAWNPLGAGVDGKVSSIVPLSMNITANQPETVISLTGKFTRILPSGGNGSIAVTGFAVWVPSQHEWLQNLHAQTIYVNGQLTAFADTPNSGPVFAGSLSSSQLSSNGIAGAGPPLRTFPIQIRPSQKQDQAMLSRRATSSTNLSGVVTGLFYSDDGVNVTILGGHFAATGTNGADINNLAFINGSNADSVTGVGSDLSSDATILALAVQGSDLYAGGSLESTINGATANGLISYNLARSSFNTQPPSLSGGSVTVHAITTRPKSSDVYIAGDFTSAGSLGCPAVCAYSQSQWNRPGTGLSGVANTMLWTSTNSLVVGGSLSMNGQNISLATYDVTSQDWTVTSNNQDFPGPVTALTAASSDNSQLWAAGTATDGSPFLVKYDGESWTTAEEILDSSSVVRGLQVLSLTKKHADTDLVPSSQTLMLTGSLSLPGFGKASAALYNGSTMQPFVLTTTSSNTGGSIAQIFSEKSNYFKSKGGHLAKGFVILICLAIALGLTFLIVVAGIIAERIRRRREGYVPAPTGDRNQGISRIPPQQLFSSLPQGRGAVEKAPMI